jgi:ABC-2 type transport system ATP-binding protein
VITATTSTNPGAEVSLAVRVQGLVKRFGDLVAVNQLDLNVPAGSQYAFLGPNGAGKSTTIACLTGIYAPDEGAVTILGFDMKRDGLKVKAQIGVVPEELALFERLTARQYLVFCARMYGLDAELANARAPELLHLTELLPRADVLVADYSKGMRRRLAIAAALIHAPRLLFLDEPFEGIDVIAAGVIRELLRELKRSGVTVFMTTHILEIADKFASHSGIIVGGRVVAEGTLTELFDKYRAKTLEEVFAACVGAPAAAGVRLSWYNPDGGAKP